MRKQCITGFQATAEQVEAARRFLAAISDDDLATFDGEWGRIINEPQVVVPEMSRF
jgi:hypothetical protein